MDDPTLHAELERSRANSVRLLESLAQKVGGARAVRQAATGVQRAAHYIHEHSVKDVAEGLNRLVRRSPGVSILVAVAAGFLVGRALRPR